MDTQGSTAATVESNPTQRFHETGFAPLVREGTGISGLPEYISPTFESRFAFAGPTTLRGQPPLRATAQEGSGSVYVPPQPERLNSSETERIEPLSKDESASPRMAPLVDAPAHPLLTVNVRNLAQTFWAVVHSKALQAGFPVSRALLDVEQDPEEGTGQAVIRVYTQASAVQALAFWDSLAIEIDRWTQRLGGEQRRTLLERIGLRFHWAVNVQSARQS